MIFRPHPRDNRIMERFGVANGAQGSRCRSPATRTWRICTLLQHADCLVANAGTILLDAWSTIARPSA